MAINYNYIKTFKDFLQFDKDFVDDLMEKYDDIMESVGEAISEHYTGDIYIEYNDFSFEFVEFIDGNNFIINLDTPQHAPVGWIILKIDWESYNEQKRKKKESLNGMVFSVQETILSYTPMEDSERYILEYKKFLASWAFWIRVCRRVELLRVVPKGRCGSAAIPRPPQSWLSWLFSLGNTREMA